MISKIVDNESEREKENLSGIISYNYYCVPLIRFHSNNKRIPLMFSSSTCLVINGSHH